jgi:hypothetical protein
MVGVCEAAMPPTMRAISVYLLAVHRGQCRRRAVAGSVARLNHPFVACVAVDLTWRAGILAGSRAAGLFDAMNSCESAPYARAEMMVN